MFDQHWDAGQAAYIVLVVAAIAAIAVFLVRTFRRKSNKPWALFFVGIYNILLLLFYLFGMLTQVGWEGFGFLPLMALTLPWSLFLDWLFSHLAVLAMNLFGGGLADTFFSIFVIHNVLASSANSCILYFLIKRHQKRAAEDEAWEQARRNR